MILGTDDGVDKAERDVRAEEAWEEKVNAGSSWRVDQGPAVGCILEQ